MFTARIAQTGFISFISPMIEPVHIVDFLNTSFRKLTLSSDAQKVAGQSGLN